MLFDDRLPDVSIEDIKLLQKSVPELLAELSLGDSLEQSMYVRERLSQSNLSRLIDPTQNPTLEEALHLRRITGIDGKSKMTVSQLQREISSEDVDLSFNKRPVNWRVGEDDDISESEFQPASLRTLPEAGDELGSSQSSELSDSLYRSAEGTIDVKDERLTEVVGELELSTEKITLQDDPNDDLPNSHEQDLEDTKKQYADVAIGTDSSSELSQKHYISIESPGDPFGKTLDDSAVALPPSSIPKEIVDGLINGSPLTEQDGGIVRSSSGSPFIEIISAGFRNSLHKCSKSSVDLRTSFSAFREDFVVFTNEFNGIITDVRNSLSAKMSSLRTVFEELESSQQENKSLLEKLEDTEKSLQDRLSIALGDKENALQDKIRISEEFESFRQKSKLTEAKLHENVQNLSLQVDEYKSSIDRLKLELSELRQAKSYLESEQQTKFNTVLMKVKKEKENSLKDLQNEIERLNINYRKQCDTIKQLEVEVMQYKDKNLEVLDNLTAQEETFLEKEKEYLKTIEEKDSLLENERKIHEEELEKERTSCLLSFEVEREKHLEDIEKQSLIKTTSIE